MIYELKFTILKPNFYETPNSKFQTKNRQLSNSHPTTSLRQFIHPFIKLLLLTICIVSSHSNLFSQYNTILYKPISGYDFDHKEAYIIQKFIPTPDNNFDGTIMVQTVTSSTNHPIQITLVDDKGIFINGFIIFDGILQGDYVPTCAAYNSVTKEYCIAGIVNNFLVTPDLGSWFLFLDDDLNVISGYNCGLDLTGLGIGPTMNMFVTDITSMEGISSTGLGDFAYVGVGGNTGDPTPTPSTTSQKQMCVGYTSTSGMGPGFSYDLTDPTHALPTYQENNQYFPTRIIELPLGSSDGGFMICGNGAVYH